MARYSRQPAKMHAKHAGTCKQCGKAITVGQAIYWSKGSGAWHVDCTTAGYQASQCTNCGGSGRLWNNAPCRACDGTGARTVQDFAKLPPEVRHPAPEHQDHSSHEDRACGDMAYEDACARACGL